MHSSSLVTAVLAVLVPFTSAIITGIAVPSTIAPNTTIPVTIITADYIQSVQDVAIAFGLTGTADTEASALEGLGSTLLGSLYLGPSKSNILGNITTSVKMPEEVEAGAARFNGVLYMLGGALYQPILKNFTVEIMVGEKTSKTLSASSS